MPAKNLKIGEILVAQGVLSLNQRYAAVKAQSATGRRIGEVLLAGGQITERDLAVALREQQRLRGLTPRRGAQQSGRGAGRL